MKRNLPEFIQTMSGELLIWFHPEPGERYVVGIDTATGLGKDYTSMQVFSSRLPRFRQVAHFRAKLGVTAAADMADMLGRYYNNALIIPEANHCGCAVIDGLMQTFRYPRLYQGEQHLDEDPDVSAKIGFYTTESSKWMLIRQMESALIDNKVELFCEITLTELGQFVYLEDKSKTGAPSGFNDDTVIAAMLALHACILYPQAARVTKIVRNLSGEAMQQRAMMDRFHEQMFKDSKNPGGVPESVYSNVG
jgi:hypothetical protein